jgi:2-polyprenyl-3-methyl-5-hydroxy-6-metoxy-1,4-benzoquinol methylase
MSVISKHQLQCTVEDFLSWIYKFKINYKNYIKPTEIKRILTHKNSLHFQLIFKVLLNNYMKDVGLSHCLTSKRIERPCIMRHL